MAHSLTDLINTMDLCRGVLFTNCSLCLSMGEVSSFLFCFVMVLDQGVVVFPMHQVLGVVTLVVTIFLYLTLEIS